MIIDIFEVIGLVAFGILDILFAAFTLSYIKDEFF